MKDKSRTNIAAAMENARTASDISRVIEMISRESEACRRNRAAMQERRRQVILEGGDSGKLSRDLMLEEERITALEEASTECQLRHTEALATERKAALEARARKAKEDDLPALREAWEKLHEAMMLAIVAGSQILELSKAIDGLSDEAIAGGRPDLAIMNPRIRNEVEKRIIDASVSRGESPVTFFEAGQMMTFLVDEMTKRGTASGSDVGRLMRFNRALAIQKAAAAGTGGDLKVA